MDLLWAWATVAAVGMAAVASPGPDFLIVARNSLAGGRSAGIATAFGIVTALCVHVGVGVLGLSLIFARSATAFAIAKYLGAAYLIFLGIQALWSARPGQASGLRHDDGSKPLGLANAYRTGVLTNLLNPKAALFFLALFTQVINPDTPIWVKSAFGLTIMLEALLWFSLTAAVLSTPKLRAAYSRIGHWLDRIAGAFFLALGVRLFLADAAET